MATGGETENGSSAMPARRWIVIVAVAALALAGVLYAMGGRDSNRQTAGSCAADGSVLASVDERAHGEVAALIVPETVEPLPEITFSGDGNQPLTLADFSGKTVLLNLWATWCVPCRTEMPALDRLQQELGSDTFEVVAVNVDTGGAEKAKAFLDEIQIAHLAFYADHSMRIFRDLRETGNAFGLPATILIDAKGCEIATMAGPAEWDSEDAIALVRAAMDQ